MTPDNRRRLTERVIKAAEEALAAKGYVSPIDVLPGIRWLDPGMEKRWRQGRIICLEAAIQTNLPRISEAMKLFRAWAKAKSLRPSETAYVARTPQRQALRFSRYGDPKIEANYCTHWVSPELSETKRERLAAKASQPPERMVIQPLNREWKCHRCGGTGDLLILEHPGRYACDVPAWMTWNSWGRATPCSRAAPRRRVPARQWWFVSAAPGGGTSGRACWSNRWRWQRRSKRWRVEPRGRRADKRSVSRRAGAGGVPFPGIPSGFAPYHSALGVTRSTRKTNARKTNACHHAAHRPGLPQCTIQETSSGDPAAGGGQRPADGRGVRAVLLRAHAHLGHDERGELRPWRLRHAGDVRRLLRLHAAAISARSYSFPSPPCCCSASAWWSISAWCATWPEARCWRRSSARSVSHWCCATPRSGRSPPISCRCPTTWSAAPSRSPACASRPPACSAACWRW